MSAAATEVDRLVALLADRALVGLSPGRAAELAGLLANVPDLDDEALDRTAAELHVALVPAPTAALGAPLRDAILADLERGLSETPRRPTRTVPRREPEVDWGVADGPDAGGGADAEAALDAEALRSERFRAVAPRGTPRSAWAGALAAAGWVLALLVTALWVASSVTSGVERRIARAVDTLELVWRPGPGGGEAVAGTLRWSSSEQAGVAELRGLASNEPAEHRYQLWVVDGSEKGRAIPAALFDVPGDAEDVRVVLTPVPYVERADRFAVTLEGPRGALTAGRSLGKALALAEPE